MWSKQFTEVMKHVLESEGGYVNHPKDPGGATNFGIAFNYNQSILTKYGIIKPEQMKALQKETAIQIYYDKYWKASKAETIPHSGLAYLYFDMVVNAGQGMADKLFAKATSDEVFHFEADGKNQWFWLQQCVKYAKARHSYYVSLNQWSTFGRGWSNRLWDVLSKAVLMT